MHIEAWQEVEDRGHRVRNRIAHPAGRVAPHAVRDHLNVTGIGGVAVAVGVYARDKAWDDVLHAGVRESRVGADDDDHVVVWDEAVAVNEVSSIHRDRATLRVPIQNDRLVGVRLVRVGCRLHGVGCSDVDRFVVRHPSRKVDRHAQYGEAEGRGIVVIALVGANDDDGRVVVGRIVGSAES